MNLHQDFIGLVDCMYNKANVKVKVNGHVDDIPTNRRTACTRAAVSPRSCIYYTSSHSYPYLIRQGSVEPMAPAFTALRSPRIALAAIV